MRTNRFFIAVLSLLLILTTSLLSGCIGDSSSDSTPNRKYDIIKIEELDSQGLKWKIYQLRIDLEAGAIFTIDLNLGDGDKVDCWYKIEKPKTGGSIDFQIKAGNTVVYKTTPSSTDDGTTSDRLSFTATQANGTSYRLIFHNTMAEENTKEVVFTEIVYPAKDTGEDSIFIPLGSD